MAFKSVRDGETTKALATISEEKALVLSSVANLIAKIPDAGGDGTAFVRRILDAESATDLIYDEEEGSEADDLEDLQDHMIRVDSLTKWASDYENDEAITDQYLIVHGYDLTDNQDVVFAVGATTPIVKLAKLNDYGALPAVVRFKLASKKTRQGYFPMNMSVVSVTERQTVDA